MKAYEAVVALIDLAGSDVAKLREGIETRFNNTMDRVTGWYTRRTQAILLVLAAVLTVGMNVDSITIADRLFRDSALRANVVGQAESVAKQKELPNPGVQQAEKNFEGAGLPIGWSHVHFFSWSDTDFPWWAGVFSPLLGWFITAAWPFSSVPRSGSTC